MGLSVITTYHTCHVMPAEEGDVEIFNMYS